MPHGYCFHMMTFSLLPFIKVCGGVQVYTHSVPLQFRLALNPSSGSSSYSCLDLLLHRNCLYLSSARIKGVHQCGSSRRYFLRFSGLARLSGQHRGFQLGLPSNLERGTVHGYWGLRYKNIHTYIHISLDHIPVWLPLSYAGLSTSPQLRALTLLQDYFFVCGSPQWADGREARSNSPTPNDSHPNSHILCLCYLLQQSSE